MKQAEDRLRLLIFDPTPRENWNVAIEPIDSPPVATPTLDVDAAVTRALAERADLLRARKDIENAETSGEYAAQPAAARRPAERQLPGERPRRHAGAPHRRFPGDHRRAGRHHAVRVGARPAVRRVTTRRGRSASACRTRSARAASRRTTRARRLERSQAEQRLKSSRGARDPAGARRGLEDRDEREADRDDARRARARRAAARRRAQAVRGRHVDELPGHPGAARSRRKPRPTSSARCWRTTCRSSTSRRCRKPVPAAPRPPDRHPPQSVGGVAVAPASHGLSRRRPSSNGERPRVARSQAAHVD